MGPLSRTFHPDEANQAYTTGKLLETGTYVYDPSDHHGPTLYYAAAPLQKLFGHDSFASLDGTLLRVTPLLFALLALGLSLRAVYRLAGKRLFPVCATALLLVTAPICIFFATDFIQEMLLAAFSAGLLWSAVARRPWWFGLFAGLAFATKETSVLTFAAATLAYLAVDRRRPDPNKVILALLVALLTAITLYSAFFTHWTGVYNAFIAAPLAYLGRAAGNAAASTGAAWHVHPWHYHLQVLFAPSTWTFSMLPPLLLLIPCAWRYRKNRPLAFLTCHTLFLLLFYSALPYKTPWCMLQVAVPLLLATALALDALIGALSSRKWARPLAVLLLTLLMAPALCADVKLLRDPDAAEIPYNYAHASPEVKALADVMAHGFQVARAAMPNKDPFIAVAVPPEDTWPLPWYNRRLEAHTGHWSSFEELEVLSALGRKPAVVVVPMAEGHRVQPIFPHLNRTRRFYVRPHVRLRVFWSEP